MYVLNVEGKVTKKEPENRVVFAGLNVPYFEAVEWKNEDTVAVTGDWGQGIEIRHVKRSEFPNVL